MFVCTIAFCKYLKYDFLKVATAFSEKISAREKMIREMIINRHNINEYKQVMPPGKQQ